MSRRGGRLSDTGAGERRVAIPPPLQGSPSVCSSCSPQVMHQSVLAAFLQTCWSPTQLATLVPGQSQCFPPPPCRPSCSRRRGSSCCCCWARRCRSVSAAPNRRQSTRSAAACPRDRGTPRSSPCRRAAACRRASPCCRRCSRPRQRTRRRSGPCPPGRTGRRPPTGSRSARRRQGQIEIASSIAVRSVGAGSIDPGRVSRLEREIRGRSPPGSKRQAASPSSGHPCEAQPYPMLTRPAARTPRRRSGSRIEPPADHARLILFDLERPRDLSQRRQRERSRRERCSSTSGPRSRCSTCSARSPCSGGSRARSRPSCGRSPTATSRRSSAAARSPRSRSGRRASVVA